MTLRSPAFSDSSTWPAAWDRLALELSSLQSGVFAAGDMKVTAAAAGGMRVDIAAGTLLHRGEGGIPSTGVSQGLFAIVNDAPVANAVTLAASNGSFPRIDQIVVRVRDSVLSGGGNDATFLVLTGTATSGATLDNRIGAAPLQLDHRRIADVLVPAASSAVTAGNIRDRRPWARGAYVVRTFPDVGDYYALSGGGYAPGDPFNVRLELSDNNHVEWSFLRRAFIDPGASLSEQFEQNGGLIWNRQVMNMSGSGAINDPSCGVLTIPVGIGGPKSVRFNLRFAAPSGSSTARLMGNAAGQGAAVMCMREVVRPSASNN